LDWRGVFYTALSSCNIFRLSENCQHFEQAHMTCCCVVAMRQWRWKEIQEECQGWCSFVNLLWYPNFQYPDPIFFSTTILSKKYRTSHIKLSPNFAEWQNYSWASENFRARAAFNSWRKDTCIYVKAYHRSLVGRLM
jgi:hypothetical protein